MSPRVLRSPPCPWAHRVGASRAGILGLGPSISEEAEVLSLQAWPSGGPCGICKVTQSLWALDLSPKPEEGIKAVEASGVDQGRGWELADPSLSLGC